MQLLCGIAFNYHDSSVSFAVDNKIILVLEAERVFRKKKKACSREEMDYLIRYGLELLKKKVEDIDHWSMTTFNNPYLEPSDIADFEKKEIRTPYWKKISLFGSEKDVLIINHHLAHAGVYLATDFDGAIIISCDGGGDIDPRTNINECLAVFKGDKNGIIKQNLPSENYITGKTYGVCSTFIYGQKLHDSNPSEGKLMALAGLGKVRKEYYTFLEQNFDRIEKTDYAQVMAILETSIPHLKGLATVPTEDAKDFAATVHKFFIDKRLENISHIIKKVSSGEEVIILTGGASLNIDLNTKVAETYPTFKHFVAPCCDDTGQSLGALCILISSVLQTRPAVDFPYLGEGQEKFGYASKTLDIAVDILLKDGILILHNGKSEIGPRALGNRSFIARPDKPEVKKKLSEKIKQRESYRPVAPVALEEKTGEYFTGPKQSPFMLYRYEVIKSQVENIIGAVHVDNSARVQTVSHDTNPFLYDLIKTFGEKTGTYVLLNTSLNLKGQPLANKIQDSLDIYEKIDGPKGVIYDGELIKSSESV